MRGVGERLTRRVIGRFVVGILLLVVATLMLACVRTPATSTAATQNPRLRIHNMGPDTAPVFVRITFTTSTTYEQAVSIVQSGPTPANIHPWNCDDPRSPTPPATADLKAAFDESHTLLLSYAPWNALTRIAAAPKVISIDPAALYMCS